MALDMYGTLRAELSQLLSLEQAWLSTRDLKLLREFVDAAEYGVALQTFVDLAISHDEPISRDSLARIKRLANLMKMESELPLAELYRHTRMS